MEVFTVFLLFVFSLDYELNLILCILNLANVYIHSEVTTVCFVIY